MDLDTHAALTRLRGIYAIVNEGPGDPIDLAREILLGGVRIVQYRAKSGIVPAHARALRDLTRRAGALFLLNDEWQAVQTYGADGVHLGPEDAQSGDLPEIRRILTGHVLGLSCGTEQEARDAAQAGADYIGVGSVFPTQSKADAGEPIGIDGLLRVAGATRFPVAAIGGIDAFNLGTVARTGVAMAAVISAIADDADPAFAARRLMRVWDEATG